MHPLLGLRPYEANDPEMVDITWLIRGSDSGYFSITSGGALTFTPPMILDFETKSSYLVTVVASDGTHEATRTVTVTITDVEEGGEVTLDPMSGLRVGGMVTATLTDEDANPAQLAAATWKWTGNRR